MTPQLDIGVLTEVYLLAWLDVHHHPAAVTVSRRDFARLTELAIVRGCFVFQQGQLFLYGTWWIPTISILELDWSQNELRCFGPTA